MAKIIDIRKARAAMGRPSTDKNKAGRFGSKASPPRVKSSMMTAINYDDDRRELDITFISGKTYRYLEVPPEIYNGLLDAESKGTFFNEHIKDKFEYREVVSRPR